VFVNSMSDLFHEDVPDDFLDQVFAVIALCQKHTFQVLTKRPERMCAYLRERASDSSMWSYWIGRFVDKSSMESVGRGFDIQTDIALGISLRNVWLGVSVEDQATADERIPLLLRVPAAVRWVSCEPLLGPIRLGDSLSPIIGLDWVVVGGESGPKARPMHPDWVASLRDQCQDARVPFFFKQWGTWGPGPLLTFDQRCRTEANFVRLDGTTHTYADREIYAASDVQMYRVGKRVAGRLLDGVLHDAYPE
jgi:protein gp37